MTPTIYTYDSLWGHYNSQEVGIVRSGAGRYLCGWIVIIVTNKNLLSQMKCVEARGRETPGFFCLIMSLQQRGFGRVASTGALRQGATAGCYSRGTSTVASAGAHRQGASAGGFGRGASTFSKYYEFPVTINGNIRLYCGTTRKRRQEKDYKRKQEKDE